ncbi:MULTISPECIES: HdeD family acid-resistance protein [Pseudomonadota]|uniref:HdeD family acid-resistance protein n=1 Tax=Pseudomonadota TaxID=1224 RepID=UPI00076A7046|nr:MULTISPECIES: DUF308 domain-containing protein [Pseudomonadota]
MIATSNLERTAGACRLQRNWSWLLLRGILALALGIVALLVPVTTLFAFTIVFAAYAGVDGLLSLIAGVRGATNKADRWLVSVLRGVLGIAAAVLFVLMPWTFAVGYALATLVVLSAWAISTGAIEMAAAYRLRKVIEREWLLGLSGLLSILLGLAVLALLYLYPLISILSVASLIAAWAIIAGVVLVALALRLRPRGPKPGRHGATVAPAAT